MAIALSLSSAALAEGSSKVQARALAWRALDLEAAGRCSEAVPLFREAYHLVPTPTLALFEGRCRESMRQLVEAEARYTAAASFQPAASSPPALAKAVSEARQRLAKLRPRIPRIVIDNPGQLRTVWLDGRETSSATLRVNPGWHELAWGSPRQTLRVELSEGEERHVSLTRSHVTRDAAMYGALGIGALGIGTGVVTGILAVNKKANLDDSCDDGVCPENQRDTLDDYRTLRGVSTWSYVVGTVGLGVGGVLLVTRPSLDGATIVARGKF
jgi:hypothetical protein